MRIPHPARTDRRRWQALRLAVFERDGWRCRGCGRAGRLECDHVTPIQHGGAALDMANLQALCIECHLIKTAGELSNPRDPAWDRLVDDLREGE